MECARRQPRRIETDLDRVLLAARLCERHGVDQTEVFDSTIGKKIWRLRRTDIGAPEYPDYGDTPATHLTITVDDRAAADRLLGLLAGYEAELIAAGKTRSTIHTYVDRTERFLRRIANG